MQAYDKMLGRWAVNISGLLGKVTHYEIQGQERIFHGVHVTGKQGWWSQAPTFLAPSHSDDLDHKLALLQVRNS